MHVLRQAPALVALAALDATRLGRRLAPPAEGGANHPATDPDAGDSMTQAWIAYLWFGIAVAEAIMIVWLAWGVQRALDVAEKHGKARERVLKLNEEGLVSHHALYDDFVKVADECVRLRSEVATLRGGETASLKPPTGVRH
jgi:hypothetical protein